MESDEPKSKNAIGVLYQFGLGVKKDEAEAVLIYPIELVHLRVCLWTWKRRTEMPRKRPTPEEIVAKLRQVDVLTSQGKSVVDAVRAIGTTEVTYYRWRKEFGGLKSDQVRKLKDLEAENARLRRAVSDLTLDKMILAEAARGNY